MLNKRGIIAFLFIALTGVVGYESGANPHNKIAAKETALDRIKRTGTIRCGYVVWAPYFLIDPNTGAMSGIGYDTTNAIARELDVKVAWTQEVGFGDYHEALNANRIDAMCVPVWQSGPRAKAALLSKPLFYDALIAFARENDRRFDEGLQSIDNPDIRVAVVDGDAPQNDRRIHFPKAQELAMPQNADAAQEFMEVASGKADVVLDNYDNVIRFNAGTGTKLKAIAHDEPVQMYGDALAVRLGEEDLKTALDSAIDVLVNGGIMAPIVRSYGLNFFPVMPGYAKSGEFPPKPGGA